MSNIERSTEVQRIVNNPPAKLFVIGILAIAIIVGGLLISLFLPVVPGKTKVYGIASLKSSDSLQFNGYYRGNINQLDCSKPITIIVPQNGRSIRITQLDYTCRLRDSTVEIVFCLQRHIELTSITCIEVCIVENFFSIIKRSLI